MKKITKKIIKIVAISIFVILVLLISIPFLFKDKLVEIAKKEINNSLNAKVEFGEFGLSVFKSFPDLNFEINNVKVVGIKEFEKDTLIKLKSLSLSINLMSVFGSDIKIHKIILDEPNIVIKVLKNGKANWDIMKPDTATTKEVASTDTSKIKLALKRFVINKGNIIYDDKSLDFSAIFKNLNFNLKGDLTEDFTSLIIDLKADSFTTAYGGIKYLSKAKIDMTADIDADLVKSKYTFNENLLSINNLELGFDGFVEMPKSDIIMDLKFEAKKTDFKNILSLIPAIYAKDFSNIQTSGKLAFKGFAKGIYNDKSMPAYDITLLISNGMFKYPSLPASANNINIDLNVKNSDGKDNSLVINLKKGHIELAKNTVDARLLVITPMSDPNIDGNIKCFIDFETLKNVVPITDMTLAGTLNADVDMKGKMSSIENEKYEEFNALGKIVLAGFDYKSKDVPYGVTINKASMIISPKFFDLEQSDLTIGKSDLKINGKIQNFLGYAFRNELLKGQFNLTSNNLDLNQFMSSSNDSNTKTDTASSTGVLLVPSNLDFSLNADLNKLLYDKIVIQNLKGEVNVKESKANLKDLKMNLLDGSLLLNGIYSTVDETKPDINFSMIFNNIDITKAYETFNTVKKIAPIAQNCKGKISIGIDLTTALDSKMNPVIKTLNGKGQLKTNNILISNTNTFNEISNFLKMNKFKSFDLKNINVSFIIKDGAITIDPFKTNISGNEAEIGGNQYLDMSINYFINFKIPRSEFGNEANAVLNNLISKAKTNGIELKNNDKINIKALITGTLDKPIVKINLKEAADNIKDDLKNQVKEVINQQIDKAKEEAIKRAKEQADKLMKDAEAKASQIIKAAQESTNKLNQQAKANADKIIADAQNEANKLINEAKNPIAKKIAQESANKLKKEADKKAKKIIDDATNQSNNIISKAQTDADNVKKDAKEKGDKLINDAQKK